MRFKTQFIWYNDIVRMNMYFGVLIEKNQAINNICMKGEIT